MNNEYRSKYLSISVIIRLITLILVILINLLVISWIGNTIPLEKSIILNLFILSLILEILGVPLVIFSLMLILGLQGINRYYMVATMTPISIEFAINIYYLIRFFGFSCFAPGITFISFPFALISLICVIILLKVKRE